ncbi:unnamed protein product [Paramecium octaurelia]|uniref:Uncharacterized protein n=1 Tax=Paramecium octaurelia TaxID=43137 RepID=A0A8S1WM68_PAROT|nr:unnamed protein product [Paramecium octaurelia]
MINASRWKESNKIQKIIKLVKYVFQNSANFNFIFMQVIYRVEYKTPKLIGFVFLELIIRGVSYLQLRSVQTQYKLRSLQRLGIKPDPQELSIIHQKTICNNQTQVKLHDFHSIDKTNKFKI